MSDDTALAELVWENEGGRVLRLVAVAPGSPRTAGVRVGRIYDPVAEHDGTRVLVDRLWPRGMTRSRARIESGARLPPRRPHFVRGITTTRSALRSSAAAIGASSTPASK